MRGVGQLVQDHPGLLVDVAFGGQVGGPGDVDALRQLDRVAVGPEPAGAGVILHRHQAAAVQVEDDGDGLELFQAVRGNDHLDVGELVLEKPDRLFAQFVVRRAEQTVVHTNGPALELVGRV
jgi:hypothetical protein